MRIILIVSLFVILCHSLLSQVDTTIYSFDGKNQFKGQMLNGKPIGIWKELTPSGEIINYIEIIGERSKCKITPNFIDSTYTGYYNGNFIGNKIILHGMYELKNSKTNTLNIGNYKQGKKTGQWRTYKNDILIRLDFYEENIEDFKTQVYNESGSIVYISNFNNNGLQNGAFVGFDSLGRITEFGSYQNGCKIGEWSFFKDGVLYCRGNYYPDFLYLKSINDTLYLVNKNDSLAKEIYPNEILKLFDFNNHILYLKHGEWYYFDSKGKVIRTEYYSKGQLLLNHKRK